MLPLIEREIVNNKQWINFQEFSDIIGISQMTPGPIAINSALLWDIKLEEFMGAYVLHWE